MQTELVETNKVVRKSRPSKSAKGTGNVTGDVRPYLPKTAQTDPSSFPPYEYEEFPKMMLAPDGKPYLDAGSGLPIVVEDEDDEAEFRLEFPDTKLTVRSNAELTTAERDELDQLRALRDANKKKLAGDDGNDGNDGENKLAVLTKPLGGGVGQTLKDRNGNPMAPLKSGGK